MISELSLLTIRRVFFPQRRDGHLAGEARIVLDVEPVQRVAAFDRSSRALVEDPALLRQARPGVGYTDDVLEPLEHTDG